MQQESSKITRYQGYCRALTEAGLELNPSLILQVERIEISMLRQEVITDALKRGLMFDGIMCTTDMLAVASEVAVEKYGLRVPEDIKITGYDDTTDYFTSEGSDYIGQSEPEPSGRESHRALKCDD